MANYEFRGSLDVSTEHFKKQPATRNPRRFRAGILSLAVFPVGIGVPAVLRHDSPPNAYYVASGETARPIPTTATIFITCCPSSTSFLSHLIF